MRELIAAIIIIGIAIVSYDAHSKPSRVIPFMYEGPTAPLVPFEEVGPTKAELEKAKEDRAGTTVPPVEGAETKSEPTKVERFASKAKLLGSSFAETSIAYARTFQTFGRSLKRNFLGE